MDDFQKTQAQLIAELRALRLRLAATESPVDDKDTVQPWTGIRSGPSHSPASISPAPTTILCLSNPQTVQELADICHRLGHQPICVASREGYERLTGEFPLAILDINRRWRTFDVPLPSHLVSPFGPDEASRLVLGKRSELRCQRCLMLDILEPHSGHQRGYLFHCSSYCPLDLNTDGRLTPKGRDEIAAAIRDTLRMPPYEVVSYYDQTSEAMMHSVLESSQSPVVVVGPDGRIVLANLAAQAVFRRPTQLMKGLPVEALFPGNAWAARFWELAEVVSRQVGGSTEVRMCARDGREFDALLVLNRVFMPDADDRYYGFTLLDISDRKRAEWLVQEQRDLGLALGGTSDLDEVLKLCLNAAFRLSRAEAGAVYLVDESQQQIVLSHTRGIPAAIAARIRAFPLDTRPAAQLVVRVPVYGTHSCLGLEIDAPPWSHAPRGYAIVPIRHRDRQVASLCLIAGDQKPFPKHTQTAIEAIASIMGSALARVQAEQALRESQQNLQVLFGSLDDFLLVLDTSGRIVHANPLVTRRLGYSTEQLLGRSVLTLHPVAQRPQAEQVLQRVLAGTEHSSSISLLTSGGDEIPVETRFTRGMWDRQPVLFALCRDVTERRRAEVERQQLEAQVQRTQKLESLGVLAGGIAHDFNNLLMGVLGNASLALHTVPDTAPVRRLLEQIEAAGRRAAGLCRQLLAYSGRGRFVVEPVNLTAIVEEMIALLRSSLYNRTDLRVETMPDLPPILGDSGQICQVVMNLITNAAEAIGERDGCVTVSTGVAHCDAEALRSAYLHDALPEGEYVFVQVADTGCGMDAETLAKIFDPFFSTKFTGRGLGLAAVLGIVRGHRGTLHVASAPGCGTTFRVWFPAAHEMLAASAPERRNESVAETNNGTVLVVDDEDVSREVAVRMLESLGYPVLEARDGPQAIDIFRRCGEEISVVLLDMTMPRMNGEDVYRELRRLRSDVRVVLSSGFDEREATSRFGHSGLAGFLQKPFVMAEMAATLRAALREAPHLTSPT